MISVIFFVYFQMFFVGLANATTIISVIYK